MAPDFLADSVSLFLDPLPSRAVGKGGVLLELGRALGVGRERTFEAQMFHDKVFVFSSETAPVGINCPYCFYGDGRIEQLTQVTVVFSSFVDFLLNSERDLEPF